VGEAGSRGRVEGVGGLMGVEGNHPAGGDARSSSLGVGGAVEGLSLRRGLGGRGLVGHELEGDDVVVGLGLGVGG
jgi:hypothetical protein